MKRIIFIFSILMACTFMAQAQPQITFDTKVKELGYVLWRNPVTVKYEFTSTGDKPLVISRVSSSCDVLRSTGQRLRCRQAARG